MENEKKSLLNRNKIEATSEADKFQFGNYLEVVKSFAKITYQSIYVIDYEEMKFEYVSNNPLFLCGFSAEEVLEMGYEFYFKNVPTEDLQLLNTINNAGFDFYDKLPNNDERKLYSISYDFHLKGKYDKPILINHKLTPLFLNQQGAVWKSLCLVSISHNKKAGNIIINKQGSDTLWKFDLSDKVWIAKNKSKLKDKELEILRLYAQGLTINQIAEKMFVSPDTIKYYRRKIFEAFEVKNFTEALSFAKDNKII
ncbi:response regulator transcription factor [Flavobacterium hibernum]|uniref:Helix-turn-helix transcriptional regulator n=1 Tax=Flavobacterium hibernum TaxID=37752 RepID=A0A0D0EWV3_9FLAO|nr:helix-turn-helix transcriptional regulator [Flavobacterium hibernum]KIO51546.1 LuxR family transcriptional regulator [Flavobacterium hibernum]OXA86449.1 helix-turn-helix transcriptional regulator [Flavobacterium hibernum]STO19406.1 DNA-binding transcriptional activator EvgA [Flavobacterium hibernum]